MSLAFCLQEMIIKVNSCVRQSIFAYHYITPYRIRFESMSIVIILIFYSCANPNQPFLYPIRFAHCTNISHSSITRSQLIVGEHYCPAALCDRCQSASKYRANCLVSQQHHPLSKQFKYVNWRFDRSEDF